MQKAVPVGAVMLAVGFGLGWVTKPAAPPVKTEAAHPSSSVTSAAVDSSKTKDTAAAEKSSTKVEQRKPEDKAKAEQKEQMRKMQSEMSKRMTAQIRGKFEKQIEKLAASLNLNDAQKASLTAWLDERMSKLGEIDFANPKTMEALGDTMKTLTSKTMEDQLQASLTPDQRAALGEYREKEMHAKADTLALKNLSKLQTSVEFEEGQRDEVYKILVANAEKKAAEEETAPDITKMMTEGMGVETDPYDLGIQQILGKMGQSSDAGTAPTDRKAIAQQMRESIDQAVEAKVDQLRPVLNDQQLEQYRKELKTNGTGMYAPMLDAMEAGAK